MSACGWNTHLFHGQLKPEQKDEAVDRFRDGDGPRILISTEAGGEGRNFQFCHILVNYDLPWNPMKVEQRIGRVDRIGQTHPVQIFNMWLSGTIEGRILDVLEQRINVFEETVGGLDPILGGTEQGIKEILRLSEDDREAALEAFGKNLEDRVIKARDAEVKLRDLIMDTKSFRKEIAERIVGEVSPVTPETQEKFSKLLLASVKTHIKRIANAEHRLTFHQPFTGDHPELFAGDYRRRCVFRGDQRRDDELVEFFSFGHPVVEAIVADVLDDSYPGAVGAFEIDSVAGLEPGEGWLFGFELTTPGVTRPREDLVHVLVRDDQSTDFEEGAAVLQALAKLEPDTVRALFVDDSTLSGAKDAAEIAEICIASYASSIEVEVREGARDRAEAEFQRMALYFSYREHAASLKVQATEKTVQNLRNSENSEQRRIIPLWESNLERSRRLLLELGAERERKFAELEKLRSPVADWQMASAGRIRIVRESSERDAIEVQNGGPVHGN